MTTPALDLTKISAADFIAAMDEEEQDLDLSQISAADFLAALEDGDEEKTASEVASELSEEDLEALAQEDPELLEALFSAVQEEEKVASLFSGNYDEFALQGQIFGTAAGQAMAAEMGMDGFGKQASASDILGSLTEDDLAQIPADDFLELVEQAELEAGEKVAGYDDLDQISAADFLYLLEEEEKTAAAAPKTLLQKLRQRARIMGYQGRKATKGLGGDIRSAFRPSEGAALKEMLREAGGRAHPQTQDAQLLLQMLRRRRQIQGTAAGLGLAGVGGVGYGVSRSRR